MAEFDNTGFSAVNDFFGENTQEKKSSVAPQQAQQPKTKRRGVGSTLAPKTQNQDLISKRVLKVGTKRNRDNDDEEEDVTAKEDDDDEEDAGRTAITPKERPINVNAPGKEQDQVANKEGGSKKLGKKERERVKKEAEEAAAAGTETKSEDMEDTGVAEEEQDDNNEKGGKKKKRRKIRSKQKNVYKDSRSLEEKPKHLVPGKRLYQGRPLTSETRTKLGLPAPKPRHYEAPAPMNTSEKGIKLAVEDLLDDAKPSQKASKKKKRPKYKNLRI
jgi:hypothetical protein